VKITAIFSLLIAISFAIFSLFQFEKYQSHSSEIRNKFQQLDESINSKLTTFQKDLDILTTQEKAILAKVQTTTWDLHDAEYLVRAAVLRLQTFKDVKTATLLLAAALDKIKKLNDPQLVNLQEALQRDLTNLQNFSDLNLVELWLKTTALIEQINQLPFRGNAYTVSETPSSEKSSSPIPSTASTDHSTDKTWKQALINSWYEMKDLIKIRSNTKPIESYLSKSEQTLIKENLRLMLEQVRFAILNREVKIYLQALQEIQQWLDEYFDESQEKIKEIKSVLTNLAEINLQPELPHITSLELFSALRQ
jgi:uncharacterized protein HemX